MSIREYFDISSYLANKNSYYNSLNPGYQQKFIKRVDRFLKLKSIVGRDGFVVTTPHKIQIAATAVQVTLGLETWDYSHFNQILIYPSEYKNPQTGRLHKGETNLGGFMCFSWKDFVSGNQTPDDKINLGLHEFTHALRFNGIRGAESDYFVQNYFNKWMGCALKEYRKMRKGLPSIFRKYGSVNINEFFSVAVETFFETPLLFKSKLPELFNQTSILLNQTFDDNGLLILNCRERFLAETNFKLNKVPQACFELNIAHNGWRTMAMIIGLFGLISMTGDGYKHAPPYILFFISMLCLIRLEIIFTRIYFTPSHFMVVKGWFLLKGYKETKLPLSHLISINASYCLSNSDSCVFKNQLITYFYNDAFYEVNMDIDYYNSGYKQFCEELSHNSVSIMFKKPE